MSELKGAMIIGQSGGPSSVINASCYGAIKVLTLTVSPRFTALPTGLWAC